MKKFLSLFLLACIAWMSADVSAQIIQRDVGSPPSRTVTLDDTGVTVSYTLDGMRYVEDDLYPGSYRIDVPGFGHNMTLTEPVYPFRWDSFEIPEGCSALVSVVSETSSDMPLVLAPAREPLPESDYTGYSLANVPPVEGFKGWSSIPLVAPDGMAVYRDRDILYVRVSPVSYNYEEGKVRIAEEFSYRVSFDASGSGIRRSSGNRHDVDGEYLSSVLTCALPQDSPQGVAAAGTVWKDAPYYLILTVPAYSKAVNTFKEWKRKMGFNVIVDSRDSWTPSSIKDAICAQYQAKSNLQYVLLFGNEDSIPGNGFIVDFDQCYTDFPYGCMDGADDMQSDLFMGRISVANITEASNVVDKIIAYEKSPPTQASFYKNAIGASYFQDDPPVRDGYEDERFVKTCEDIREALSGRGITMSRIYFALSNVNPKYWNNDLYGYGDEIPLELQRPNFAWNGNKNDIVSQINTGVLFALHRNHGEVTRWQHPSVSINDLNMLNNGNLTPVIFSINCLTGSYQTDRVSSDNGGFTTGQTKYYPTCLAEKFLSLKDGAVGVFAASSITYSGSNDVLAFEMLRSVWPTASFPLSFPSYDHPENEISSQNGRLGVILKSGVDKMIQYYTPVLSPLTSILKKAYHCFGDPSMRMYSKQPYNVVSSIRSSGKLSAGQEIIFTFDKPVNISAVYGNGTVKVASGTQITLAFSNTDVPEVTVFGQDIRTTIMDSQIKPLVDESVAEIESVSQESEILRVRIKNPDQLFATLSLKSLDGNCAITKNTCVDTDAEFDVSGLDNGIYTLTLYVEGKNIQTTKIILK